MNLTIEISQAIDHSGAKNYGYNYSFGYSFGPANGGYGDRIHGDGYGTGFGFGYGNGNGSGYGYGDEGFDLLVNLARNFPPAIKITSKWLRRRGACSEQIDEFNKVFPDGAEPTLENLEHAKRVDLDTSWLLRYIHKIFVLRRN